jgi:glycosyltransferase involved in cell wall biosynthesis
LIKSAWIKAIERANLENASAIHTTSRVETDELQKFNWQLSRIVEVPNGIDDLEPAIDSEPAYDVKSVASSRPLALFFGRLSWKKGLDRLLEAFAHTSSGTLVIVGPDEEGLVKEFKERIDRLKIRERVRILPRVVLGVDKEYLFSVARLFVLPSYSENFGNTVVESMQRGVPVIITPEVGAADIVRAAGSGLL